MTNRSAKFARIGSLSGPELLPTKPVRSGIPSPALSSGHLAAGHPSLPVGFLPFVVGWDSIVVTGAWHWNTASSGRPDALAVGRLAAVLLCPGQAHAATPGPGGIHPGRRDLSLREIPMPPDHFGPDDRLQHGAVPARGGGEHPQPDFRRLRVHHHRRRLHRRLGRTARGTMPPRIVGSGSSGARTAGVVASRNEALSLATGEFLAVMDSDDVALPPTLDCTGRGLPPGAPGGLCVGSAALARPLERERNPMIPSVPSTTATMVDYPNLTGRGLWVGS